MACALALAAGTGLALGATVRPALADPFMSEPTAFLAGNFQIALGATGAVSDDSAVSLEVRYHGGSVGSIELTIDGMQVKKRAINTRTSQGTIRFELDPGTLGEGDHLVTISATDRDGNNATTTTQLHVTAGDPSSLARLLFPKKNTLVQGIVPIEVKVDDSVRRPFVSFFVDHATGTAPDFALVNFAPFTYNWDSTRAVNGPHTISIEVMDGDTQAIVKRFSVVVNVNNPGGLTNRQTTVRDLNVVTKPQITDAVRNAGKVAAPHAHFDSSGLEGSVDRSMRSTADLSGAMHEAIPDGGPILKTPKAGIARPDHVVPPVNFSAAVTRPTHPGVLGVFTNPHELFTLDRSGLDTAPGLRTQLRPRRVGNIAAMPEDQIVAGGAAPVNAHSKPVVTARPVKHAQTALVGGGALSVRAGAFDVAFDNTRIAFDVPPRVEHGLPLAPFRQIFEHTGGTVKWYGQSRTVRAYNSTREIEFKVGQKSAKVNNLPVKMDAKTYLDRGRAIVPLSFVRDAMNVSVQYDAATGHLRIESRH
jgi:hypothetical protein